MRFLEARTAKETGILNLVEKRPNELFKYAILSHTWENDEITFNDIENDKATYTSAKTAAAHASLSKILGACGQAAADGYEYIWIDSCCIDKRSSSELSEAINSMFAWYHDADICYAFLLKAPNELVTTEAKAEFATNKWFTRGWTLQELLAPKDVIFFSGDWVPIGEKKFLCLLLAEITGVDFKILLGDEPLDSASIARRMSWAAQRVTTRPEDKAYCLMGIFSVNMPMLYGEGGEKAFLRLQEEIMKQSDDESLFAWVNPNALPDVMEGLLAADPSYFLNSNTIIPYQDWEPREPYTLTNRGLKIGLHLTALNGDEYVAALDCPVPPDYKDSTFLAIYLQKLSEHNDQYARIRTGKLASVSTRGNLQTVYVPQKPEPPSLEGAFLHHLVQLRDGPSSTIYQLVRILWPSPYSRNDMPLPIVTKSSARKWVAGKWSLIYTLRRKPEQLSAALIFIRTDGAKVAVLIGTLNGFNIAFSACELGTWMDPELASFEEMEALFKPTTVGRFELSSHSIRVSATPVLRSSDKYYIVDIGIEAIDFTWADIVREAFDATTSLAHSNNASTPMPEKEVVEESKENDRKPSFWKHFKR
ncbi:Vegetative incompatibility protein HET-E-1 [Daldinia childiae]|uniref:Vegetative incompatibility protein HET-E-1 n=1 Tax=Daldinia childiae TaxID=326645 RepID=UPI001445E160|nr:Vegetative incompatibility protein HET-E-1 [Daldinia childiae]KAF3059577.1 Vegetative incompatibility protein HET-E-1 [Daldinia childiae]